MTPAAGPPRYTAAAVDAFVEATTETGDFAGWLAEVLARTASRLGPDLNFKLYGRPGSWESSLVGQLLDSMPPGLYNDEEAQHHE